MTHGGPFQPLPLCDSVKGTLFPKVDLPICNQRATEREAEAFLPKHLWVSCWGKSDCHGQFCELEGKKTGSCNQRAYQCHEHFTP